MRPISTPSAKRVFDSCSNGSASSRLSLKFAVCCPEVFHHHTLHEAPLVVRVLHKTSPLVPASFVLPIFSVTGQLPFSAGLLKLMTMDSELVSNAIRLRLWNSMSPANTKMKAKTCEALPVNAEKKILDRYIFFYIKNKNMSCCTIKLHLDV